MDLSLFFFADSSAGDDRYRLLLDSARFADEHGFRAVWTPERHFHPFGGQYPNPAVTGAALAAVTRQIGIRAGSVVAPLHHQVRIAEEWSVVDNLSDGRAGISFASGWHAGDFVFQPDNYKDRKNVMAETVEVVRRLWRGETIDYSVPEGLQRPVRLYPRPVQPELPVWITAAGSPQTYRLAGRLGAGVLTHQLEQDHAALDRGIAAYRAALKAEHGDGASGHVVLMLHTLLGEDREEVRDLVRAPLTQYLSTSMDLLAGALADTPGDSFDLRKLSAQDREVLLERAFGRLFDHAGLFGTIEDGVATVERLNALGVDEIACLIDFGAERNVVLDGLERLDRLRRRIG
ncbi:natural product biosynthesis luciferase-like monooxygenase protein [Catenulispora sp. GP43]|uniref:MupA/Atu3671 family FMN-dependent luciferase-like monooxygenase n=1 Tax=Catenulispora sp. GP43 TaxID=3156263 RepID=UPI003516C7CC